MGKRVVLSYGLGWDSTGILLRWLVDPASRDFSLDDLIVLTAQVGEEFPDTKILAETYVYPLLRYHGVRCVQVARAGPLEADGVEVLSDTHQPHTCHTEGRYRLSCELLAAGTVPMYASGKRRCTLKSKGVPLDSWLNENVPEGYRHVMGYNNDELRRVRRDRSYCTDNRQSEYPLVQWQWGRAEVEDFVRQTLGVEFARSACTFCPFSGGRRRVLQRYRKYPDAAAFAVFLEGVSTALNPRMTLYSGGKTVRKSLVADGNAEALARADARLDESEWALYRVQRIYFGRAHAFRRVRALERGSRHDMGCLLRTYAAKYHATCETSVGSTRAHILRAGDKYPTRQDFLVAAPGVVDDKSRPTFERRWREIDAAERQMQLFEV